MTVTMTKIHKFSMHSIEFIILVIAGIVASFAYFEHEKSLGPSDPTESISGAVASDVGEAPNFAVIENTKEKKQAFFDYLKPGIELENQRVKMERERLEEISSAFSHGPLTEEQTNYAQQLGNLYNVELPAQGVDKAWLDTMLHRVDVLPPALVLIQAANESAWGTSRFATQGNNFFGQWCYTKGCGLVPRKRKEGMDHEVAKFSAVQESINGYFMNVNRNDAYEALRKIRYKRHLNGDSLIDTEAALHLTNGLLKYSERGEAYVNDIKTMISHNRALIESPTPKQ